MLSRGKITLYSDNKIKLLFLIFYMIKMHLLNVLKELMPVVNTMLYVRILCVAMHY